MQLQFSSTWHCQKIFLKADKLGNLWAGPGHVFDVPGQVRAVTEQPDEVAAVPGM